MAHLQFFISIILLVSSAFGYRISQTDQKSSTYTAAVVELNPHSFGKGSESTYYVTEQIVDIIQSKDVESADILVFPESILNDKNTPIQLPNSFFYCGDRKAPFALRNISCAVRNAKKYVVINVYVEVKCSYDDQPYCVTKRNATNLYNMAIVFDREGEVIAKYRKYNLFNEEIVHKTVKPDIVAFKTDFNVTFGIFVCFDMMFAQPAMSLINHGIKHFVYPTMWSSEIPYLTATQFQQSWAYTNDVTLLAANANIPNMKSSGSGIYAGRFGALKTFMSETAASKILIAEVPINPDAENFNADELVTSEIDIKNDNEGNKETNPFSAGLNAYTFDLLQENLSNYSIEFLNFTENSNQAGSVCNNGICCNFDIEVSDNGVQDDKSSYAYAIAAFNGHRSYRPIKGLFTTQAVCSVIACSQMNSKHSCGRRILNKPIHNRYNFNKLVLKTELPSNFTMTMQNSLTSDLVSLTPKEFQYDISKSVANGNNAVDLQLKVPKSNLLTFAIFSRDFGADISKGPHSRRSTVA